LPCSDALPEKACKSRNLAAGQLLARICLYFGPLRLLFYFNSPAGSLGRLAGRLASPDWPGIMTGETGSGRSGGADYPHLTPHRCDALLFSYATVPREHGSGQGYHWAGARTVARGAVTLLRVRWSWNHMQSFLICYDLYICPVRSSCTAVYEVMKFFCRSRKT
jgi:hypothetical protein